MSLERSVELMVQRLQVNQGFPKYQFERSVDAFLSLFLVEFFNAKFNDHFIYVAAEFPLRKENTDDPGKQTYQSTNVDYLLLQKGHHTQWHFVELKTDKASQRDTQLQRLQQASGKRFAYFYNQIAGIQARSKRSEKYEYLVQTIETQSTERDREAPIVSICLTSYIPNPVIVATFEPIQWIQLSDFDAMLKNTQHPELWEKVKLLFSRSNESAR